MKDFSVKDLVLETLSNFSQIKTSADKGNAESCFKMGLIYLIGINTKVWFNKASQYFNSQSLSGDHDVILLLGFIEECECNYSRAFQLYAQNEGSEKDSYIDKVIKGRNHLQDLLKKLDLPQSLNKEISSILSNYGKGKSSRTGACTKIAVICNDEPTCLEVAKCLFDAKDYISAIEWLKRGKVEPNDSIYTTINKKIKESTLDLLNSKDLQVINLESISLLSKEDPTPFFKKVKDTCNEASMKCSEEWKDKNKSFIDKLIKEQNDQAYLASLAEEENAKRKKSTRNLLIGIAIIIILGILVMLIPSSSDKETKEIEMTETKEATSEKTEDLNTLETNKTEEKEDMLSEEYLKKYLEEIIPVAMKMDQGEAVKKYFSKDFIDLYQKVVDYDNRKADEVDDVWMGYWDGDFWTGGQDGYVKKFTILSVSEISKNKAVVTSQIIVDDGANNLDNQTKVFNMFFENGKWLIDDFDDYKRGFRIYLTGE